MNVPLSVKNISKVYTRDKQKIHVLSKITMHVRTNEFVSIIGPNGCGKSTLLKIIVGIEQSTAGTIVLSEQTYPSYMPQHHALLPWRTVTENLLLPSDITGIPRKVMLPKIAALLQEFKLNAFAGVYPSLLSGGMQQRVALLRTILYNKSLLLLDEPFAQLDALTRIESQKWLLDLWGKVHATVMFVTHDIREAILLSDTIYVMSKRPGEIKKTLTVSLPRPRDHTIFSKKSVIDLEKQLLTQLFN